MSREDNIVEFNLEDFKTKYPFITLPDAQIENNFDTATYLINNGPASAVQDYDERAKLLELMTCHLSELQMRGPLAVGNVQVRRKVKCPFRMPCWLNPTGTRRRNAASFFGRL